MKSRLFILTATAVLIIACIIFNVAWPFYIIIIGNGFGVLALLIWFQSENDSKNKKNEKKRICRRCVYFK